jgi:hypothetical protein
MPIHYEYIDLFAPEIKVKSLTDIFRFEIISHFRLTDRFYNHPNIFFHDSIIQLSPTYYDPRVVIKGACHNYTGCFTTLGHNCRR